MAQYMTSLFLLIGCYSTLSSAAAGGGSPFNAALYKPAYQSSTLRNYYPYFGNDGNNTDVFIAGHCQHTQNETWPWWMVDLRGEFVIQKLVLTNRGDFPTRLRNFTIDIFKADPRQLPNFRSASGQICYSQIPPLNNGTFTWQCRAPIVGRFVRLIMYMKEFLHICELEVYVSNVFYRESSFIIHLNQMLRIEPSITVHVDDVITCSLKCFLRRENDVKCIAFNWFTGTGECQLFQVDPKDSTVLALLEFQAGCYFVMEDN